MRRPTLLILLAATLAAPLAAGEVASPASPQPLRLTLSEAVARAREVSASLKALDFDRAAAEAAVREAVAGGRPQIDATASYTRSSDVPELAIPQPDGTRLTIFPNLPNIYRARLGVWQPLYTGGRVSALAAAARGDLEATARDRDAGAADLVLEVTSSYWSLLTARENVAVLEEGLAAYEAHLSDARNRQRVGLAAASEVLAVEVERDRAQLARLRAASGADLAAADLVRLLDLEPGTPIELADELSAPPPPGLDLEALVAEALAARPERAALLARRAAAAARVSVEQAARRPQVSLTAGYDYANPNSRILPPEAVWRDTWDIGVGLSLRLFDGGRAAAAAARVEARADALEQRIENLERGIRLEVTSRLLDLGTAESTLTVSDRALEAARENLRVSRERYREGVMPSSELLDAEVGLLQAGLGRTDALASLRLAAAGLDRAVGR